MLFIVSLTNACHIQFYDSQSDFQKIRILNDQSLLQTETFEMFEPTTA